MNWRPLDDIAALAALQAFHIRGEGLDLIGQLGEDEEEGEVHDQNEGDRKQYAGKETFGPSHFPSSRSSSFTTCSASSGLRTIVIAFWLAKFCCSGEISVVRPLTSMPAQRLAGHFGDRA